MKKTKSAIVDIFHGIRGHIETMPLPNDYFNNSNDDLYDELKNKLTPELLSLHEKVVDIIHTDHCKETDFYFAQGFKLGLLIGLECAD